MSGNGPLGWLDGGSDSEFASSGADRALRLYGMSSPSSSHLRPEIRRDYPLNLSILLSGGKETNKDSHSNGE